MKKNKKTKPAGLNEQTIAVGDLYCTTANQYRAVLAIKGEFLIYAPSAEGMEPLSPTAKELPFNNSPHKKCQLATFAQKSYQEFDFMGSKALRHTLTESQLAEAVAQSNAKLAIAALLA
ncbi:hypothetical protein [Methylocucumis oryzae]|uniref:Uncharacterized protein n=1 Tax=Methylocucumis oryzae TaxID=1632867 RepID=A0A0F3IG25_9GAMM|nr:hypothetical protein [Methylocucumis oryzae]KJV05696.1 hypothetical protein VZ94_16310 [Methylocucumis oryzae]